MKKNNFANYINFIILMLILFVILILSFFDYSQFNEFFSFLFAFFCANTISVVCYKIIDKYLSRNFTILSLKTYIVFVLFVLFLALIQYCNRLILKFSIWTYSWKIECKIVSVGIMFVSIIIIVSRLVYLIKKSEKLDDNPSSKDDFSKLFEKNDKVTKEIDDYLDSKNIDGALLINGTWGSGKTYYINKYIEHNIKKGERAVYVSLNGLKTIEEVNNALFASLHPILSGAKNSLILSVLKCAIKFTSNAMTIDYDSLFDINLDFSEFNATLIVFDDLERCQIDIPTLFGYFDLLMKSCNKMILIANERELVEYLFPTEAFYNKAVSSNVLVANSYLKKEKQEGKIDDIVEELKCIERKIYPRKYYEVIKEKIVWNTIEFAFDLNVIFNVFIKEKKYKRIEKFVNDNKSLIEQIENYTKCSNLRTYKCALDYLNNVYINIDLGKYETEEIKEELLVNVFMLTISYKNPSKIIFDSFTKIGNKEYKRLDAFSKFYGNLHADYEELKTELNEMESLLLKIKQKKIPNYIIELSNTWIYKTDEQLTKSINALLDAYNNKTLNGQYFLLCYHYLYAYKNNYKFQLDEIDLENVKNELIKRVGELDYRINLDEYYFISHNLNDFDNPKMMDDIHEIYKTIQKHNEELNSEEITNKSLHNGILNSEEIIKLAKEAIGRRAFLSLFKLNDLMDYITRSNNETIESFRTLIHQVYFDFSNIGDFFEDDKESIEQFKNKLEKYQDECESKTKLKIIEWLIDDLNNILGRL